MRLIIDVPDELAAEYPVRVRRQLMAGLRSGYVAENMHWAMEDPTARRDIFGYSAPATVAALRSLQGLKDRKSRAASRHLRIVGQSGDGREGPDAGRLQPH